MGAFLVLQNDITARKSSIATADHDRQKDEKETAEHCNPHCFITKVYAKYMI
jgi:hypothetical protein